MPMLLAFKTAVLCVYCITRNARNLMSVLMAHKRDMKHSKAITKMPLLDKASHKTNSFHSVPIEDGGKKLK